MIKKLKEAVMSAKNILRREGRAERKRFGALDQAGAEILDSTPMAPPVGYNPQPSMFDVMREQIRRYHTELEKEGYETPEEADDFDIPDDVDPTSPWEHNFDPPAAAGTTPEVPGAPAPNTAAPVPPGPIAASPAPAAGGSPQGGPAAAPVPPQPAT